MKRFWILAMPLVALSLTVGCGGGGGSATVPVQQDELAKWNAENPSPPETPVDEPAP